MPKPMGKVLFISNQSEVSSSHLVDFTGYHTAGGCFGGDILGLVDMVPNATVQGRNGRVVQCEGLSDHRESRGMLKVQDWKTHTLVISL
jgi:hypothetical protein